MTAGRVGRHPALPTLAGLIDRVRSRSTATTRQIHAITGVT
jgi:hypothetical protein